MLPIHKEASFVLSLLNSNLFHKYAKLTFVDKQAGWYEIQPEGLMAFPIPAATAQQQAELERLTHCLTQLKAEGAPPDKLAVLEEQLNDRVADLFRLTPEERRLIAAG